MATLNVNHPTREDLDRTDQAIAARDSVAVTAEMESLVPRPRPFILGGCSDMVATLRHRRRERRRDLTRTRLRAA
jgi:hypothetical protein